jgi:hypothetical protein
LSITSTGCGGARYSSFNVFEIIQRAGHTLPALLKDMGIDHSGRNVIMAEQGLNGADVIATLKQMGGETVTFMPSSA